MVTLGIYQVDLSSKFQNQIWKHINPKKKDFNTKFYSNYPEKKVPTNSLSNSGSKKIP